MDVRDSYIALLQEGLGKEEAYQRMLDENTEYIGDEDEPLFWYALADTQWKTGRLEPEVKAKALEWIERDGGLEPWLETPSKGKGWQKTLAKLKEKLLSPQPKEKKIRKPVQIDENLWNVNDVYAYQFYSEAPNAEDLDGKYILLQKIGEGEGDTLGVKMRVQFFDKVFDELPTLENLQGVRLLPFDHPASFGSENRKKYGSPEMQMSTLLEIYKRKSEYPEARLTYIGSTPALPNVVHQSSGYRGFMWRTINDWLSFYFVMWQGVEYKDMGDGVYWGLE
jgi:hypothetical protein